MKHLSELSAGLSTWLRFRGHLAQHRAGLVAVALLGLATVGLELARPWPIGWIVDHALAPVGAPSRSPWFYVGTGVAAALAISVLRALGEYLGAIRTKQVGHSVTRSLRNAIFGHLCRLSPAFHARNKTGDMLVRLMGDVPILRTMLVDSSVVLATRVVLIVGTAGVMLALDPLLALVTLGLVPLVGLVVRGISRRLTVAVHKQRKKEGAMADFLHEALAANTLIHSLGRTEDTARTFAHSNRSAARAELKAARLAARMSAWVEVMLGLALGLALGVGSWRVIDGHLTAGQLLVFLSYVRNLLKPLRSASKHADKIAKGTACGARILALLEAPIEVDDRPDAAPAPADPRRLSFERVGYTYPDGTVALSGLDATLRRGELVAVFGRSGSGKSTLASLATRIFDPTDGRVLLDGVDLRSYRLASLRERIGLSLQEPVLFGDSIRENLLLGRPDASDEELLAACAAAAADDLVERLPEGLDTVLGSAGVGLSGGERRRLCLARTLLRGAPVVIVDEPFVGLDKATAERVRVGLRAIAERSIVIVITHETEHLGDFDRILFLERGTVRAAGSHAELLGRELGYRSIVRPLEAHAV